MTTTIGERLALIRGRKSQAAFAAELGVHKNSLGNYERGERTPDADFLARLAEQGISVHWVLTGEGPIYRRTDEVREEHASYGAGSDLTAFDQVALYDVRAAAGDGAIVAEERPVSHLAFRRDWLRVELGAAPSDLAAITAEGESMAPVISPGDVILVDMRDTSAARDGIYVLRLDDALVVKRIQRLPGRRLVLRSEHPAYEPYELSQSDLENGTAAVIGRVVWAGRRM